MTLTVNARHPNADGELVTAVVAPPHNNLFGFESWRTTVWGSRVVWRLGLRLLPSLSYTDVYACGVELDELAWEVEHLRLSLHSVVEELSHGPDMDTFNAIEFRLANVAEAVRVARTIPNGVVLIG